PVVVPKRDSNSREQQSFSEKLKAFRKATGTPEKFLVVCACARYDAPFTVRFERFGPEDRFQIVAICADGGTGTAKAAQKRRVLRAEEIDDAGWRCPHCGNDRGYVHCGQCQTIVCGSGIQELIGSRRFVCRPSCGETGSLTSLTEVTGTDAPPEKPHGHAAPRRHAARLLDAGRSPSVPLLGKPRS
ncbi:MAG: hypothetical protein KIT73_12390, partial [Burkholderiales bacterium]|nr:hypothetical protein [Burkholderiales bacterium]